MSFGCYTIASNINLLYFIYEKIILLSHDFIITEH